MMKILSIVILITMIVVVSEAQAQLAPLTSEQVAELGAPATARFGFFRTGDKINENHPLYDTNQSLLEINLLFENVHDTFFNENMRIYVNGRDISELDPQGYQLTGSPPTAPDLYGEIGGEVNVPVGLDENYPLVNLTAELVHDDTGVVLARNKLVLYESVNDSDIAFGANGSASDGYRVQITNLGIGDDSLQHFGGLETVVSDVIPAPSAEAFSQNFGTFFSQAPSREETDLKTCVDYADLDDERFSDPDVFLAYRRARDQAEVIYGIYQGCRNSGGGAKCKLSCVRKRPKPEDFKLCVNTMTATPIGGEIEGPSTAHLEFLDSLDYQSGLATADVTLQNVQGDVDITLSDLSVNWRKNGLCLIKPKANVREEEISDQQWLEDFTTCHTNITADNANTRGGSAIQPTYQIAASEGNADKPNVTDGTLAEFVLNGKQINSDVGTCAMNFVKQQAKDLLSPYTSRVLNAVEQSFNLGAPTTMMAEQLTELLAPLELDVYPADSVQYQGEIREMFSSAENGLVVKYSTQFEPDLSQSRGAPLPGYFSQYFSPFLPASYSLDQYGEETGAQISVATDWLNAHQAAKGFSDILNGTIEFTAEQLDTDAYGPVTSQFSGAVLKDVHPSLAAYADETVEVVIERKMDPFFYINPDPSQPTPLLGAALNYFIDEVRIRIKAPDTELPNGDVIRGEDFISMVMSLYDPDFDLYIDDDEGAIYLDTGVVPNPENSPLFDLLRIDIIDFDISDCPKYKHDYGDTTPSCERQVESALRQFLRPVLAERLAKLLGDIPAPQFFEVRSEDATSSSQLQHLNRAQFTGNVTLSGEVK